MLGLAAAAAVVPLTTGVLAGSVAQAAPVHGAAASGAGLHGAGFHTMGFHTRGFHRAAPMRQASVPSGVKVTKVEWLTDRRVAIWVHSAAMNTDIQVQMLLARDWNSAPDKSFPELLMLDGLRAQDDQSGWTINTDIVNFFADKNVNVVLPVGGQSSFYSNWEKPDNGKNYQWETFLTKELPPILHNDWRTSDVAGIAGLSMGGTAAMMLAERHADMFKFVASYSGFLETTSMGMPQAIQFAMLDAGGFHSENMWGPPSDPRWKDQDPYLHADKLKGMSIYISSGNGAAGAYDQVAGIPGLSTNWAGTGLEILSRLTSQNFAGKLDQLGIPANVVYRPSGTHTWPYWQFEMHQSWPQVAAALGVEQNKPACAPTGAIGVFSIANPWLGPCLTNEYAVPGGRAEDFYGGRVFWSNGTGAQSVGGAIGGAYQEAGGPAALGLPTTSELPTPDKRGRFNYFQKGAIYWTAQTGAHAVSGPTLKLWGDMGHETSQLGYPVADQIDTPNGEGTVQGFQIGAIYHSAAGTHEVQGEIMKKYASTGYEAGPLGFPTTNELGAGRGSRYNGFQNGNIYWSPATGAWTIRFGPIWDAWKAQNYENGKLGLPIGDEFEQPDGSIRQNFQFGYITAVNGVGTVH